MSIAHQIGRRLPGPLKKKVQGLRDHMRFRSIGLVAARYDGPLEFLGTAYGGAILPKRELAIGSTCYAFGAGEDISFEVELARSQSAEVHVFDPTPRAIAYVRGLIGELTAAGDAAGQRLRFHPWGVWSSDTEMKFFAPQDPAHVSHSMVNMQHTSEYFLAECRSLKTIMRTLGHQSIALMKLNIEGAEYEVMRSVFEDQIRPSVICINFDELHTKIDTDARNRLRGLVQQFAAQGYICVAKEACRATFVLS